MKKTLSLILSILLLISAAPMVVFADDGENICLEKSVYADGIHANDHENFGAQFANDGIEGTTTAAAAETSEGGTGGFKGYIVVDLGEPHMINKVVIKSRRDLDAEWARMGFAAYIASKEDLSDAVQIGVKDTAGEFKSDLVVELKKPKVARYIIAAGSNKTNGATIAEIEAYGEPYSVDELGGFADLNDAAKHAANLITKLGIIEGVTPTELGTGHLISRGEAAKLICNFANITSINDYKGSFEDVDSQNEYAPYIQAGLDYGFISADINYRPDEYIKTYEFVKMILCINGYYSLALERDSDYPSNILAQANDIDLLENIENDGWSHLNRSDAIILMYNAYISYTFGFSQQNQRYETSSETLLERLYDYKLMRGIVTGNPLTQLDTPNDSVSSSNVWIDKVMYADEQGIAASHIGEAVYFLIDEDNNLLTLWTDIKRVNKVTLYDTDISNESDFDSIKVVDDDNKTTKYTLADHPYILLNDVAASDVTKDDLIYPNGHIILLDNNGDMVYDVIKIYQPEIHLAMATETDEYANKVTVQDENGGLITIQPEKLIITDVNNKTLPMTRLKSGKLLYVYTSENGKLSTIQIQSNAISGKITGVSGDYISIGSVQYKMSSYFINNFTPVSVGKEASFFVDKNNKVIYMTDETDNLSSEVIAVVMRAFVSTGGDENVLSIYDENKQFQNLAFADKVNVNGNNLYLDEIEALGRDYFEGKLVIANVTSKGTVNKIVTEDNAESDIAKSNSNLEGTVRADAGFYSGFTLVMPVTSGVPVFTLPIVNGRPATSGGFLEYYNVTELSNTFGVRTKLETNNIGIYGTNEYGEPTALVNRCYYEQNTLTYGVITAYNSSGAMVIERCIKNVDVYGDVYYTLKGYDLTTGQPREFNTKTGIEYYVDTFKIKNIDWFEADVPEEYRPTSDWFGEAQMLVKEKINSYFLDNITNLKNGDIIRYDKGGYSDVSQLEKIADYNNFTSASCRNIYTAGDSYSNILSTYRLQYAIAEEVIDGRIKFLCKEGNYETIELGKFGGKITVVENGKFTVYPMSSAGVCISPGDRLVIYSNAGYHKSIVVYK